MKAMSLKNKIQSKKLSIGSWLTIAHPAVPEILSQSGFEWLAIDMEHAPVSNAQCQELIRTIDLCGMVPLVRIGANNSLLIKQALDAGAHGIIVPMVNSASEAHNAVQAAYYPPKGRRGVGLARAQNYGQSFSDYKQWADKETIVIIQIEDVAALPELDNIFSVPGIDGYMIGPYDLSGSMGCPGDFECEDMKKAMDQIKEAAAKHNISAGMHVVSSRAELVKEKIKEDYSFIAYGVDFLFLGDSCIKGMKKISDG